MDHTPFRPRLKTQADVEAMWRHLMSPLGFASTSLWLVEVERGRPVPQVREIFELGQPPTGDDVDAYARMLSPLAAPETRLAFLLSRPGSGRPTAADRAWALALYDAGRRAEARLEVIHLAHDRDVLPLAMDDLLADTA
jgi:hypothetical protein